MEIIEDALKALSNEPLVEMANIRGKYVKVEDLDFSFYYSSKLDTNGQHGIRVKICWNREKIGLDLLDGYMELHDDYKYVSTSHPNYKPDSIDIATARYFFKKYKVLFAAAWELVLDENILSDYLRGNISLLETIDNFENVNDDMKQELLKVNSLKELEQKVRENKVFNLND